jgi:hypothetical protein
MTKYRVSGCLDLFPSPRQYTGRHGERTVPGLEMRALGLGMYRERERQN